MTTRTYVLVGAGGTGSILLPPLMRYLTGYHVNRAENHILAIIDGDHVEEKNLARQMFEGEYVEENKANALTAIYGDATTRAIPEFLSDDNIEARIFDGDTVLIAADNYDVRARIERHGLTLQNLTVINGGNEDLDGSLQLWLRRDGQNVTPQMSFGHAEILVASPHDPSRLSCAQRAELPGGEQTIVANMMSATQMLNAVRKVHEWERDLTIVAAVLPWHELYFDLQTGNTKTYDRRPQTGWQTPTPEAVLA